MAIDFDSIAFEDGVEAVGYTVKSTSRLRSSVRAMDTVPTLYDIQAAFGTPTEVGDGFLGVLNPSGAGTSCYLCACDGTNWFSLPMTLMEA